MDRKIIDYLPKVSQDIEEIQQICHAEQISKEKLWDDVNLVNNQRHVSTQTEIGANWWESILEIVPNVSDSISVRNSRIISKLQDNVTSLKIRLNSMTENDYSLNIDFDNFIIDVKIGIRKKTLLAEITDMVDRMTPAHFIVNVDVDWNTHKILSQYSHDVLALFTHKELREEYLPDLMEERNVYARVPFVETLTVETLETRTVDNIKGTERQGE